MLKFQGSERVAGFRHSEPKLPTGNWVNFSSAQLCKAYSCGDIGWALVAHVWFGESSPARKENHTTETNRIKHDAGRSWSCSQVRPEALKHNPLMLRGIARFADVGLQYLGVAEDNQTGKTMINCLKRVGHR